VPITLTINGQAFEYPLTNELAWGPSATNWAVAVTEGMLQKEGGAFTLLNDVNFGPSFGLVALDFTSISANPAVTGVLQLSNTDKIAWRNGANNGDILIGIDSSNNLTFNGQLNLSSLNVTGVSSALDTIGSTQGDILYRSGAGWTVLAPGTAGYVLQTNGAATNPTWSAAGGNGVTLAGVQTLTNKTLTDPSNVFPIFNQNTTGNAATATNVAYSGLTGTVPTWNQNTTGNAATATTATAALNAAQIISGSSLSLGSIPSGSFTYNWFPIGGFTPGNAMPATEATKMIMTRNATVKNLYVNQNTVSSSSATFQILKNGLSSGITCTIGSSATSASDLTHSFTVVAGDVLIFQSYNVLSSWNGIGFSWSFEMDF